MFSKASRKDKTTKENMTAWLVVADSRCWLAQEGVLVESVGCVAVKGARLHGNTFDVTVGLLGQVEGLEHPEACHTTGKRGSEIKQNKTYVP